MASLGTFATTAVGVTLTIVVALTTLNVTSVAPPKPVPLIVTFVPATAAEGVKLVTFGTTVNVSALVVGPPAFVIVIGRVTAPVGTVALICVLETSVIAPVAVGDPNAILVTPLNVFPVIVTTVPAAPLDGANDVIVGRTPKLTTLVAVPAGVVTVIFAVSAPAGTCAVIWKSSSTVNVESATVPNLTDVAPVNDVPMIVTVSPTSPDSAERPVIAGVTLKAVGEAKVPSGVVTLMVASGGASGGTVAVTELSDTTVKDASIEPNLTLVAPVNAVPFSVTSVPTGPVAGVTLEMPGVFTPAAQFQVRWLPTVHSFVNQTRPPAAVVSAAGSGVAPA